MENKGLNYIYGIIGFVLALLSLVYGGYLLVPLFGVAGAFLGSAGVALVGIVLTVISGTKFSEVFPLKLPSAKKFFGAFMMMVGITLANSSLSLLIGRIFDAESRNSQIESILLPMNPVVAILLIAVLPAVCEEFFCRGFMIRCFSSIKNEKVLIALVGVLFGILHLDLYTFFPTAISGAFFCYVALKTQSLIIPIILHFANNAYSTVMTYVSAQNEVQQAVDVFSMDIGITIGMCIVYAGMAVLPLVGGLRLFKGQKLFHFKSFVALLVAVGCINVGSVVTNLFSYSYIDADYLTMSVEGDEHSIDLDVNNSGNYTVFSYIYSDDKFVLEIISGEETLYRSDKTDALMLNETFECGEGDCRIVLRFDKGEEYDESIVVCLYGLFEYVGI